MKKTMSIFIIAFILLPFKSVTKNIDLLSTNTDNIKWQELLEALKDTDEPSKITRLARTKIDQPESYSELSKLSWELISSALEKTRAISLFERIVEEKWRQTEHGELFKIAGNSDDDQIRLNYLKRLYYFSNLKKQEIPGLKEMIEGIELFINSKRTDYFHRSIQKIEDYDLKIDEWSPLYPTACIYRARMIIWAHTNYGTPEMDRPALSKALRFMRLGRVAFPENRIVRMYLGEAYLPEKHYPGVEGAPEWAVYQREGIERLTAMLEWWCDNRMRDNAEYGGGWGDDCEMWRSWVPILIGFDSPKITWAQTYFSEQILNQPHLKGGYNNRIYDVEHTAEDVSDALTPMMHLEPDNPEWKKRALRLAELMENLWTGVNDKGFLQFKSTYISVDEVDTSRAKACDTVYHPRAVQPALLLWQRTGDRRLGKLFSAWMDTWVDAAASSERGKPAGILPTAVHWPEGFIGGVGENWWLPKNHHPSGYWLYGFPSAMSMMAKTLLLTYYMTGDTKYIGPIRSMANVRLEYLKNTPQELIEGSKEWCASRIGFISETVAKYRLLTGSSEFDELLMREDNPYTKYRVWGDEKALTDGLKRLAAALRINFPGHTSEVRYTDRVFRFPTIFGVLGEDYTPFPRQNLPLLYSTATGDPGDARYFPLNSVRWLTPPRNIAALVTETGKDLFTAELFHFGQLNRKMAAELYLLDTGRYGFTIIDKADGKQVSNGLFEVKSARTRISFELPPRRLYALQVRKR